MTFAINKVDGCGLSNAILAVEGGILTKLKWSILVIKLSGQISNNAFKKG